MQNTLQKIPRNTKNATYSQLSLYRRERKKADNF